MASTYVNDLRLNEMATGDGSGTWGTTTNTNLELIGEALGYGTEGITTNADTHTSTIADGATDPVRSMYVKYTGTLDSACTITIAPNTVCRMQFIENATSGSQNIIISQGSGANVTIPAGDVKAVYLDGAGSGAAVVDAFASLNVVDLKVEDDLTVTDDLIVNGDIDLEGAIDVNGTANLDVVDIDGAVDMASTLQVDGAITSSAGMTLTVADNSDVLTIVSTDADASSGPNITLYRNSGSPADSDNLGDIHFKGRNDNSQDVEYAVIDGRIVDASDGTEDGKLEIVTIVAGSGASRINMINTETVLNEDSIDLDFRVESNGNANMIFVDGGNDHVSIGTNADYDAVLNVLSTDNAKTLSLVSTDTDANAGPILALTRQSSSSAADNDYVGEIKFEGLNDGNSQIAYAGIAARIVDATAGEEDGRFEMYTDLAGAQTSRVLANSTETVINQDSADLDFRVESDSSTHMLFVDGGNNAVGINRTASQSNTKLEVGGADNVPIIAAEASGVFAGLGVANSGLGLYLGTTRRAMLNADGLHFGSSDTAAANALDDYEEGTFTPSIAGVSGTFVGHYTKIGDLVTCCVACSGLSGTASASVIGGFPFTAANTTQKYGIAVANMNNFNLVSQSGKQFWSGHMLANTSTCQMYAGLLGGANDSSNVYSVWTNVVIEFSVSYKV